MTPAPAERTAPNLPRSRGRRHCERCGRTTAHTAVRRLAPSGRRLVILAGVVTAILYGHSALRFEPGPLSYAVLYWVLPAVVGAILVFLGCKRQRFAVRCELCDHVTFRLSPPRWTPAAATRENTR
ncbi:MAG: hypothetical protein JXQ29_05495 [Planctomycetes bacterium]|nr:hypothetical protein [Planctomycetota bacterium]